MLKLKAVDQLEFFEDSFGYNCSYDFPYPHAHDYWEFVYVKYELEHLINNQKYVVPANSVFIVKPNDVHLIQGIPSMHNPDKSPTHLNVKVADGYLREMLCVMDPNLYANLENTVGLYKHIGIENSQLFEMFFSTLIWSSAKEKILVILKTFVMNLIIIFFNNIYKAEFSHEKISPEIELIIRRMNSQRYLSCSIAEITKDCNYSYMQLSRLFKKYTGMTMAEYFLNIRLENAAMQLKTTDKLILEISNDIGISSLSHFNHIFKKKFNMSPSKYRNKQ